MKRVATKLAVFLFGIVLPILLIQALTTQKVFGQDLGLIQGEVIKVLVRRGVLANPGASFTGGDITGVTAGTGLTGGATSGNATLTVDLGVTVQAYDAQLALLAATATPTYGQIPIGGNGTYTVATITTGTGITITPAAGSITIAATGGSGTPWIYLRAGAATSTASPMGFASRNSHPVYTADPATDESVCWDAAMDDSYASGSNVTAKLYWTAAATTGDAVWNLSIERMNSGFDIDADSFATSVNATTTTSATNGGINVTTFTLANADMDSIAAGEPFRVKLNRDANNGSDTLAVDAEVLGLTLEQ